jgi:hypothetical protein
LQTARLLSCFFRRRRHLRKLSFHAILLTLIHYDCTRRAAYGFIASPSSNRAGASFTCYFQCLEISIQREAELTSTQHMNKESDDASQVVTLALSAIFSRVWRDGRRDIQQCQLQRGQPPKRSKMPGMIRSAQPHCSHSSQERNAFSIHFEQQSQVSLFSADELFLQ